jgi:hypothetical protein
MGCVLGMGLLGVWVLQTQMVCGIGLGMCIDVEDHRNSIRQNPCVKAPPHFSITLTYPCSAFQIRGVQPMQLTPRISEQILLLIIRLHC